MIVVENVDLSRHISMAEINNEIKKERTARCSIASENIMMVANNELERSNTEYFGQAAPNNNHDNNQNNN